MIKSARPDKTLRSEDDRISVWIKQKALYSWEIVGLPTWQALCNLSESPGNLEENAHLAEASSFAIFLKIEISPKGNERENAFEDLRGDFIEAGRL
jgi:hypothetical protein